MRGVYQLIFPNDPHGRVYTGRSLNVEQRYKKHIKDLKAGNHHNYKMQDFYNCYNVLPDFEYIEGSFNSSRSEQKIQNTISRPKQWNISKFVDNPTYKKKNGKNNRQKSHTKTM